MFFLRKAHQTCIDAVPWLVILSSVTLEDDVLRNKQTANIIGQCSCEPTSEVPSRNRQHTLLCIHLYTSLVSNILMVFLPTANCI